MANGEPYTLVLLQSLHSRNQLMHDIRNTFLFVIPFAILLASAGGYFLPERAWLR